MNFLTAAKRPSRHPVRSGFHAALDPCGGWWMLLLFGLLARPAIAQDSEAARPVLKTRACDDWMPLSVPLPPGLGGDVSDWNLQELDVQDARCVPTDRVPQVAADGTPTDPRGALTALIPPDPGNSTTRRFSLVPQTSSGDSINRTDPCFRWETQGEHALHLSEDHQPVLTYNFGPVTNESVPTTDSRRVRGCYVHPLWGLQGETLTADFPADHFHHHGLFWAWKHIQVGDETYDSWENPNIEVRFVRWLGRDDGTESATLGVENGWYVGQRMIMTERFWLQAYRAEADGRAIDLRLTLIPTEQPVLLSGDAGKSYGGMTLRFDVWPRRDAVVRTPERTLRHVGPGQASAEDLSNTALPWADLAAQLPGSSQRSGAALLVHPQHPDYPPTWLTRCYGPLCVGWPGTQPQTLTPNQPVTLAYRLWIHRGEVEHPILRRAYDTYLAASAASWETTP